MPKGWAWCRLGDIGTINPKNKLNDELDVSFIPMPLISDAFSNVHTSEVKKWGNIKKGYTHFCNEDIGIAKITPCFENRKSVIFNNLKNGVGAGTTELYILRNNKTGLMDKNVARKLFNPLFYLPLQLFEKMNKKFAFTVAAK